MTTLKDLAKALDLSPATVSRALNGFPEVSAKTRDRVKRAASKMKYRPNQAAQKLVSGRSGMVGMVLKPNASKDTDAAFYEIMFGLSEQLVQRDIDLVFHASTNDDLVLPYRRFLEKQTLDGFILNAPEIDDPRIAFLQEAGVPFVVHGRTPNADYAYYDVDNEQLARDAVELLADLGHKRIALLNGPESHSFAAKRLRGFDQASKARGAPTPPAFIRHGRTTEDFGYSSGLSIFSGRDGPRPTAVICASTLIASGIYKAAHDLGMRIPEDVSIIAHDDAVPQLRAVNFSPALTVTSAPLRNACAPLARIFVELLGGADAKSLQQVDQAELIVRDSTSLVPDGEDKPW